MVAAGVDADGVGPAEAGGSETEAPADADAEALADGAIEGAGVTSGALLSADGTAVAGVDGTGPRPPDVAHAVNTRPRTRYRDGRRNDRGRTVGIGRLQVAGVARSVVVSGHGHIART
jgi:hypothetical protein